MFGFERQEKILAFLKKEGNAAVSDLAKVLGVTEMTIRRDLSVLKDKNLIYRTHGGAVYKEPEILWQSSSLEERSCKNVENKKLIANYVATQLIKDRDTLFIDAGSTPLAVAKQLKTTKQGLLVITNSDVTGTALLNSSGKHKVILAGGIMEPKSNAQTGPITESIIRSFQVGKAIIGTSSIIPDKGLFATSPYESEIKRLMIANSQKVILVSDSSKLDVVALNLFCSFPCKGMTLVIDSGIYKHKEAIQKLTQNNIKVFIV